MSLEDRLRWDAKYAAKQPPEKLAPDVWLQEVAASLRPGRALELACGLGQNAIWLGQQGWQVDAVDVSPVGIEFATDLARRCGANVHWIAADLDEFTLPADAYDLICVFRFLDRTSVPRKILNALRQDGLLIYETFSIDHISRPDSHMKNPAFALAPGELQQLFPTLQTLFDATVTLPDRTVVRFVGKCRS